MSGTREYAGQAYGNPVTPTATMRFLVNRDGATKVCVIGDLPFVSSAQLSAAISASLSGYATTAALSAGLATKADSSELSNYALTSSLGDAATKNVGTAAGTVAAGNDSRFLTASGSVTAWTGTSNALVHKPIGFVSWALTEASTLTDNLSSGEGCVVHTTGGSATNTLTLPAATCIGTAPGTLTGDDVFAFWKIGTTLYYCYGSEA